MATEWGLRYTQFNVTPLLPVVVLLVASSLWGLTWLPLKHFGEFGIEGPLVTLVAHGSVGLVALPFLWRSWPSWRGFAVSMGLLALFGGLANLTFASAMVIGDVTRVMVLFYLLPAWGVIGGRLILGERIDRRRQLGLVFSLLGAFLILGGFQALEGELGLADILGVVAGLTLALHNVLFRKLHQVAVPTKIASNFVGCLVWAALVVGWFGAEGLPSAVPSGVWLQVVSFGAIWILAATAGTLWGVHHLEASRSSVLIVMELLVAVASAMVLAGERPTPIEWLGGASILCAALLEAWRPNAEGSAASEPELAPSSCDVR